MTFRPFQETPTPALSAISSATTGTFRGHWPNGAGVAFQRTRRLRPRKELSNP